MAIPYSAYMGTGGGRWTHKDRVIAEGYQTYLDDLCGGCGWPRTYSMHPDAQTQWKSGLPTRCFSCTAVEQSKEQASKNKTKPGTYYGATPSPGMAHAMSDPILTYEDHHH